MMEGLAFAMDEHRPKVMVLLGRTQMEHPAM